MVKKTPKHQEAPERQKFDSPGLSTPRKSDHLKSPKPELKRTSKKRVEREESEQEDCFVVEENNLNTPKRKRASCRHEQEKYSSQRASERIEREENVPSRKEQERKQEEQAPSVPGQSILLQYYTGRRSKRLDTVNSFIIQQGRIYDLLQDPFLKQRVSKEIKCNCYQSRCKAKYCLCFSNGKTCGLDCGCTNCANLLEPIPERNPEMARSCKCQKSHCLKKYCQCRKYGEFCSPQCKCLECLNTNPAGKGFEKEAANQKGA